MINIYLMLPTCLFLGGATAEVSSSLVVLSLCTLVVLVVLLANCVSCCKDPEIDFKVSIGSSTCTHRRCF